MKVRLYLKKKGGRGAAHPIYVALYSGDSTEIVYTGERLSLKDWNPNECGPRDQDSEAYHRIKRIEADILKVKRLMEAQDLEVTPYSLKQKYELSKKQKTENQQSKDKWDKTNALAVSNLIDKWIEDGLTEYQPSTRKVVITSIKMFKDYLKISGRPKLERKDINLEIIGEYAKHLEVKKKLKDSTHGKKMKHLRWFLKWIKFDSSHIKEIKLRSIKPDERNIIALTLEELTALENIDVSDNRDYQRAKDMFLLGCYTGLRISDLKRITRHRIENGEIQMTLKKNRKNVGIPLLTQTKSILERYDWSAPRISEQQVNDSIKKVCEKAGIAKQTFFKAKKAGVLIETIHPKHELITTHCAGKTFITLANAKWGLTPTDIAAIVGKDIKTILGYYLKPDQETAKQKILKAEQQAQMKIVA